MTINRQNYQIWITDYYDGQLDSFQTEVLMDFLSDNPDLMSEFEDYPGLRVSPADKHPYDNTALLRSPEQLTNEQVEHFTIALLEDDLDEAQREEVEKLSMTDPRFRKNIGIYEKIRLKPDNTEYPLKSSLLKIPGRRRITGLVVNSLSIAASIAILAGLFFVFNKRNTSVTNNPLTAAVITEDEKEEEMQEDQPLLKLRDEAPRYVPALTEVSLGESPAEPDIVAVEAVTIKKENFAPINHLAVRKEVVLNDKHLHYLLAEVEPGDVSLGYDLIDSMDMSVREYLAYQFRKQVLREDDPGIDNLKAWEIAGAGIKGMNALLGWNMELVTEENNGGRLENISFTSELLKFDHKFRKNNADL